MSYNDRALPPSRLPDVMHVTLSPRPSPSVLAYCKQSKNGGGNDLGTRLHSTTMCSASLIPNVQQYSLGMTLVCHDAYFHKLVNFQHPHAPPPPPLLPPSTPILLFHCDVSFCFVTLVYLWLSPWWHLLLCCWHWVDCRPHLCCIWTTTERCHFCLFWKHSNLSRSRLNTSLCNVWVWCYTIWLVLFIDRKERTKSGI